MAETYSVEAFLSANISGFKAGFDEAKKQLDGFQDSADQTEKKFAGGLSIGKIAAGIGLIYGAKKALDLVKNSVQSAFGRIDTMEQFERVMTTMTGSSKKANEVLEDTNEIVKGTAYGLDVGAKAVQDFVTSNMDVDKATETVASWGDAVAFYGNGSNESFASVSDALAKMTSKGKVQMDTMNRLTEAGIPAMQIYADATGQSVEQVAEQMSKGKLDAGKFTDVMNDALSNGTKNFDGIAGAAKEAGASWGASFDNMQAAVTRGVVNIIQKIDEMLTDNGLPDMRTMVAEFGKKFEEVLNKAVDVIPVVANKLMEFYEVIKKVYENLKPWLPIILSIATGLLVAVKAFEAFRKVKAIITGIKLAFLALNTTMLANPIFWLIAAIIAAAILIYVYWEPISKFFIKLWGAIKESGLAIWEALKKAWSSTVEWLKNAWSGIATFFTKLWSDITKGAISVWDSVKSAWTATIDWFEKIWSSIKTFFTDLWTSITGTATSNWDKFVSKLTGIVGFITTIFSPMIDFFSKTWSSILDSATKTWNNVSTFLSTLWKNIQVIASSAWEIIKNVILGPILLLINLATGDMEEFKANLVEIWTTISEAASRIWEALKEIVSAYVTQLVDNITLLWTGFTETFTNLLEALKETISNIWTTIVDFVIERISILGEKFEEIMQGIKDVIDNAWAFIENLWLTIIENIVESTGVNFESIRESVMNIMDSIKEIIDTVWNFIKETFQIALLIIRALVTGDFAVMKDMIGEQMKLIRETISTIWANIKKIFSNALDAVKTFVSQGFENVKNNAKQKMVDTLHTIKNTWDSIKRAFADALANVLIAIKTKFDDMKTSVKTKMEEVLTTIKDIWDNVMSFFREIDLNQIGKDIIMGLIKGIKSKVEDVGNAVKDVTSAITGKIKSILQIKSPSRVFMGFGDNIVGGLAIGMDKARRVAERAADMLGVGVTDAFNPNLALGTNDIAGQVNSINAQANRQMQSHLTSEFNVAQKEPAYIYLNLGMREYEAFVEDISGTQDRHTTVKESFRN